MFGRYFKIALLFFVLVEIISFIGYYIPLVNLVGFFVVALVAIILSCRKLEYGLYILFAELFVGSKGYLFYFDNDKILISIRIALFIIIFGVWLSKFLITRKTQFLKSSLRHYWVALIIFVLWGICRGFLNGNDFSNILLDANAWLFLFLILPFYDSFKDNKKGINNILQILFAAIIIISVKTLTALFVFTNFGWEVGSWSFGLYRWIWETGVGEVTLLDNGFYRVFLQSQIWVLTGLFVLMFVKTPQRTIPALMSILALATILVSLSRSFWVGGVAGLFVILVFLLYSKYKSKKIITILAKFLFTGMISFFIVFLISPSFLDAVSGRAKEVSGEAAVSSRWNLLSPLWSSVSGNWLLGSGFGSTVTYKTEDPRVLEKNPGGEYTTYAFEWGYLDIWLKIGIGGLLVYLLLIGKLFYKGSLKIKGRNFNIGLLAGLIVLCVVNIFSPYLNHPLGIGYLILLSIFFNKGQNND